MSQSRFAFCPAWEELSIKLVETYAHWSGEYENKITLQIRYFAFKLWNDTIKTLKHSGSLGISVVICQM
jgi:hypothetical protein